MSTCQKFIKILLIYTFFIFIKVQVDERNSCPDLTIDSRQNGLSKLNRDTRSPFHWNLGGGRRVCCKSNKLQEIYVVKLAKGKDNVIYIL